MCNFYYFLCFLCFSQGGPYDYVKCLVKFSFLVTDFPEIHGSGGVAKTGANFIKATLDERHIGTLRRIHLHLRESVLVHGECVCRFHRQMRDRGIKKATKDSHPKCGTWWAFHFLSECLKYIKTKSSGTPREPKLLFIKHFKKEEGRRNLYNEAMKLMNASQQGILEVLSYTAGGKWDQRFRMLDLRYPLEEESAAQVPKKFCS